MKRRVSDDVNLEHIEFSPSIPIHF